MPTNDPAIPDEAAPLSAEELDAVGFPHVDDIGCDETQLREILEAIRWEYDGLLSRPSITNWGLLTTPPPGWLRMNTGEVAAHYRAQRALRVNGRVQWAIVMDYRSDLRVIGTRERPLKVLYGQPEDLSPQELVRVANRIAALEDADALGPEEAAFVRQLAGLRTFGDRVPVPPSLSGGHTVWAAWCLLDGRHVKPSIQLRLAPIVVADDTPVVRIVPAYLWPETMAIGWETGHITSEPGDP